MKLVACLILFGVCGQVAWGAECDDEEEDLCDDEEGSNKVALSGVVGRFAPSASPLTLVLALALSRGGAKYPAWAVALIPLARVLPTASAASTTSAASTCGSFKQMYKATKCCGNADKVTNFQLVPMSPTMLGKTGTDDNYCEGQKPSSGFENINCLQDGVVQALEQAGTNVTDGYQGGINTTGRDPITDPYWQAGLCPVNVHWHLGTEHLSVGEYDENGKAPAGDRRLKTNGSVRKGFSCHKYDGSDSKFTTEYAWKHCQGMHVGETYEVHWPHSAAGACGTPYQYQTPFYDGVFCKGGIISLSPLNTYMKIGVQAQVFTIINDEQYFYPDLIRGMIVDGAYGEDIAKYTGSTTGTSRSNEICSAYTPITWQVDRKCHLISASAFDKMCADMEAQRDDMSNDLHAHGSRELVNNSLASDNHQRL